MMEPYVPPKLTGIGDEPPETNIPNPTDVAHA
jgi:hypothetical protein